MTGTGEADGLGSLSSFIYEYATCYYLWPDKEYQPLSPSPL